MDTLLGYKKVKNKTKKYPLTVLYSLYGVNRIIELLKNLEKKK